MLVPCHAVDYMLLPGPLCTPADGLCVLVSGQQPPEHDEPISAEHRPGSAARHQRRVRLPLPELSGVVGAALRAHCVRTGQARRTARWLADLDSPELDGPRVRQLTRVRVMAMRQAKSPRRQ